MKTILILAALAAADGAGAATIRGDLAFPLEGWGIVSRWSLGAATQSVREGWIRKRYNDGTWMRVPADSLLPAAPEGSWLRNGLLMRSRRPGGVWLEAEIPDGARLLVNGIRVPSAVKGRMEVTQLLHKGVNAIALVIPPHGNGQVRVPAMKVIVRSPGSAIDKTLATLRNWRFRKDSIAQSIPEAWLGRRDPAGWVMSVPYPPSACEGWVGPGPLCLRAILDVPAYWRGRRLSAFFHEIPGSPAVWVNGNLVVAALSSPARVDLGGLLKFDGFDRICLVYAAVPPCPGGVANRWGMAAIRWEAGAPAPRFHDRSVVMVERTGRAGQEGLTMALRYASQLLSVSATPFSLGWSDGRDGTTAYAGAVVACWSGGTFSTDDLAGAKRAFEERGAIVGQRLRAPVWFLTEPPVGRKYRGNPNDRIGLLSRGVLRHADAGGFRVIPLHDVVKSALRRQRRWPVQAAFSDEGGILTGQGAYLAALAILDTLSLP